MFKKSISLILIISLLVAQVGSIQVEAIENSKENIIKEYLDIMICIKEEYGILTFVSENGGGLIYADLLDFDGDGNEELFYLYKNNQEIVYDVWKYIDNKVEKIHTDSLRSDYLREQATLSLVSKDNKTYILKNISAYGLAGIEGIEIHEASAIKNGQWANLETLECFYLYKEGMEEDIYFMEQHKDQASGDFYKNIKDGKESDISEKEYAEEIEKYYNSSKIDLAYLGHGGAGSIDIPTDILEDRRQVVSFIEELKEKLVPNLKDIYQEKTSEDKKKVINFLNQYNSIFPIVYNNEEFDITNINQGFLEELLHSFFLYNPVIIDYKTEVSTEEHDSGRLTYVYEEDHFNKKANELFGINIDFEKSPPENYEYKDGHIYIEEAWDALFNYIPIVNKMYSLGDGLFYLSIEGFINEVYEDYQGSIDGVSDLILDKLSNREHDYFEANLAQGYVILKEAIKDGEASYELIRYNTNEGYLTEEELSKYVTKANPDTNIIFDYSKVKNFKEKDEYLDYFKELLDELEGQNPNDKGKIELIKYIEYAIEDSNVIPIESKKNQIIIDKPKIEDGISQAQNIKLEFDKILEQEAISLNKNIETILKVSSENLNTKKPLSVIVDKSIKESLNAVNGIRILLGDNQHTIYINSMDTIKLINELGNITVQIEQDKEKDEYSILFIDKDGKALEEIPYAINFSLPSNSEFSTIFVNYKETSDNWGGQYNSVAKSIEFSTRYSGQYIVLEKQININDIDDLTEEQKNAIAFMVSKGYFDLDGDRFNGEDLLTRYEFTTALVKMFFALDRNIETGFTDIEKSNIYYSYIASAEKDAIVDGFEDNTFRGEKNISKEEVISICGRTLADKKGYIYPEEIKEYLKFVDKDMISDWAINDVSISVQNELIHNGGILMPQLEINRAEGAEVLYNLFMLLYDNPPIAVELEKTQEPMKSSGVVIASILALLVAGSGFYYTKRKRK